MRAKDVAVTRLGITVLHQIYDQEIGAREYGNAGKGSLSRSRREDRTLIGAT